VVALRPMCPPGIEILGAQTVPLRGPALPSLIRSARYRVTLFGVSQAEVAARVRALLARDEVPVTSRRRASGRRQGKAFDLRPLIGSLNVLPSEDVTTESEVTLEAELLRDASGRIGRPDTLIEVLDLGANVHGIHRTEIQFADPD